MATRFTDTLFHASEGSDFVVRNRRPMALRIFAAFAIAFVAIYLTGVIMNELGNKMVFLVSLTLVISLLGGITLVSTSQHRDLVMVTEFQNALLASAAQLSTRFCVIIKRDLSIAYIDPNFQKLFPQMMQSTDATTIRGLLSNSGVPSDLIQNITALVNNNESGRIMSTLQDTEGLVVPVVVTVDALPRPKGYFLVRGRDYVEKRTDSISKRDAVSAKLLCHALDTLPEGVLVASKDGAISYVNHILEEWLGYDEGEICNKSLAISQLVHQYGKEQPGKMLTDDYDGEVLLNRKDRTIIALEAYQTQLSEKGQLLGVSLILNSLEPHHAEPEK